MASGSQSSPHAATPQFTRPYLWAWFAMALVAIPIAGFMVRSELPWVDIHPAVNAVFNATAGVFLVLGRWAVGQRRLELHRRCMVTAFAASTLFLISYLIRYKISGTHPYPGDGWDKVLYLVILFSHMALAAALPFMALRTLWLGLKDRRAKHSRLARWTWPIWLYVSVTGLIVYLMLYPIAGRLYPQ